MSEEYGVNQEFNVIKYIYGEFEEKYLDTGEGKEHFEAYGEETNSTREIYKKILNARENGQKYAEDTLYKLIAPTNVLHKAHFPRINFKKEYSAGEEQIKLADAFLGTIQKLLDVEDNINIQESIVKEFAETKYSKGFGQAVFSRPLYFLDNRYFILNYKTFDTVKFLSQFTANKISIGHNIINYIKDNEKLHDFLEELAFIVPDLRDFKIFDMFCHWLCDKNLGGYASGEPLPVFNEDKKRIINMDFYEYLVEKGYFFDKEIIENYLLSLKVKPFVILTGNSGTGKTRLAQLFAQYLSNNEEDYLELNPKLGKAVNSNGWILPRFEINPLFDGGRYEKYYDILVDDIPSKAKFRLYTRLFFGDGSDELKDYLKDLASQDPNQKVDLKIKVNNSTDQQYKIVPVGANWTENRHILGFYNVVSEEYQSTPSYDLIKDAQNNFNLPFFLILDEMNLSHVERYFADFLSALESGEKIPLYHDEKNKEKFLEIPKNLLVVGTVNVDETTYMFSPKVLDRANTIEFKTYSAKDYMSKDFNLNKPSGNMDYLTNPLEDLDIREMHIDELRQELNNVQYNNNKFWDILAEELDKFQEILKKAGFDFGFRVINEIIRFMYVAWKYEGQPDNWTNWERYFDAQIKQKMLPKLHGSERAIGKTIHELFNNCLIISDTNENPRTAKFTKENCKYYTAALKLQEMDKVLTEQRYVSFIN